MPNPKKEDGQTKPFVSSYSKWVIMKTDAELEDMAGDVEMELKGVSSMIGCGQSWCALDYLKKARALMDNLQEELIVRGRDLDHRYITEYLPQLKKSWKKKKS